MLRIFAFVIAFIIALAAQARSVAVEVTNPNPWADTALVEVPAADIFARLGSPYCYVKAPDKSEITSQVTHDSLLVFVAALPANSSARYTVHSSKTRHGYIDEVCGRAYPERADDIAWENQTGGYRIYGPATQRKGERAFGYDLFFKYPGRPVVRELYAAQCSSENWHKVDSLRRISNDLAKEFENSFTYHLDHGKGMDCYAVGATLGAGVAAPLAPDMRLCFAWCYSSYRILDNGPLRFTVELTFEPREITVALADGATPPEGRTAADGVRCNVTERRIISLDSHALLNRCRVEYDGMPEGTPVAMGFPLRDDTPAETTPGGIVAYSDPTQGTENGRAFLGIICPEGFSASLRAEGHMLGVTPLCSGALSYRWGFVWSRNNPGITIPAWTSRLTREAATLPLTARLLR